VSNSQFRDEAIAAANAAIQTRIGLPFNANGVAVEIPIDVNRDGASQTVVVTPRCISASIADAVDPSSLSLPPEMSAAATWNTVWDIEAVVTELQPARRSPSMQVSVILCLRSSAMRPVRCLRVAQLNAMVRGLLHASLLLLSAMPASAEDIDLFVNAEASSSAPNVLFVIDNAADFSSTSPIPCEIDGAPSKLPVPSAASSNVRCTG